MMNSLIDGNALGNNFSMMELASIFVFWLGSGVIIALFIYRAFISNRGRITDMAGKDRDAALVILLGLTLIGISALIRLIFGN